MSVGKMPGRDDTDLFMTVAKDFSEIAPFQIYSGATGQLIPFVFNSPHSGRYYPDRFLRLSQLDPLTIRQSEDCYVDELFGMAAHLGAPFLCANFPRAYLDVNREPWELDQNMFFEQLPFHANTISPRVAGGLGTIPKLVAEGIDIYGDKLPVSEALERINLYYRPYHTCLHDLLFQTREKFGYAILIDCHSMPAMVRLGENKAKPDFILGDRFGMSTNPELTHLAMSLLMAKGYSVVLNRPYAGGFITEYYGRPSAGFHALQIEVNRGLYMNEKTLQPTESFSDLVTNITEFIYELTCHFSEDIGSVSYAAE